MVIWLEARYAAWGEEQEEFNQLSFTWLLVVVPK